MQLLTDFNEVDGDEVWVSLRGYPTTDTDRLLYGEWVELYDEDGETCWAQVVERRERSIVCRVDWSTWRSVQVSLTPSHVAGPTTEVRDDVTGGNQLSEHRACLMRRKAERLPATFRCQHLSASGALLSVSCGVCGPLVGSRGA